MALWEVRGSHYFSLLCPATSCLGCFPLLLLLPFPALTFLPLWTWFLDLFVVSPSFIFFSFSWFLFVSTTYHSLSSSLFIFGLFVSPSLFPLFLPSNLLTSNNLSCLISLFPATSFSTIFFFFFFFACLNYAYLSPPSQLLLLRLISDADY